ncbi:hypothetical protein BGZ61DRAFT_538790 [Ilyonectria robusta]|uniref:uncharacterized protein n=1 Tax=Ilyonectria robusta TaxID=1079257 RepID=UPI001E8E599D|nr:uncharacterized protein BGZ61DRAFT_538790 [Ilyonectria robusta]KAH8665440.1 hypothetical protein BGZ61DRAFT_538790 [Ilyonectria robusta]
MSSDHRGQVFYLSPESLKVLKAEASPNNASKIPDQSWVSTNDALSTLLWRTVMAVQNPFETLEGDLMSVFNIAIDGQPRTDPPVHPALWAASWTLLMLKALILADKQFTGDVVALVEALDNVDRIFATMEHHNGRSFYLGYAKIYGFEFQELPLPIPNAFCAIKVLDYN